MFSNRGDGIFRPKQESIISGSVSAGLLLDRLLLNSMNSLALEAVACKIVEDCHQIVANNINRHFSFLQDMVPVVSSKILNSSLTLEQIMVSTLENCVKILLTDICRDIEKKLTAGFRSPVRAAPLSWSMGCREEKLSRQIWN